MQPLLTGRFFLFILSFLCVSTTHLYAQLSADFTPDKTGGCSPVTISFKNNTTNASAAAVYKWDFGNGNSTTTTNINASVGATYSVEKTYTITLTVIDGSNSNTKTQSIIVYKKPIVEFSVLSAKGCSPFTTTFTSNSAAGDGNISNYFWDFGDGNTQRGAGLSQVINTFTYTQKAKVGLTVTNSYGCQATTEKADFVETLAPVTAAFSTNNTMLCHEGDAVRFTNTSTGSDVLSYSWDFGDGVTGTEQSPTHAYAQKGNYTVKLAVTSSNGCKGDTMIPSYINVANFNTDFNIPALICQNSTVTFKNKSSPAPASFSWQIDTYPVSSNYDSSVSYYFYNAGTHKVTLINNFGSCSQSMAKTIVVNPQPVLNGFVINNTVLCGAPTTVSFKDTCSTAVAWNWDFTYNYGVPKSTANTQSTSYTYTVESYYNVYLLVTDAAGCTASAIKSINVQKPYIGINVVKSNGYYPNGLSGCNSLTVTLAATPDNTVTDYLWDFGDGGTSTLAQPEHTYTAIGNYNIKLTYTTAAGCKGVTASSYIANIYKKPVAAFTTSATTVCGNTPVVFINSASGTSWVSWFIGGLNIEAGATYTNYNSFSYQFSDTGLYTIKMIAFNNGCTDTLVQLNYIHVLPPFPKISAIVNTCSGTRGDVLINQASRYATQWQWDYGDGSAPYILNTDLPQVSHTYTKTGMYKVALTVVNGRCTVRDSMSAFILLKQNPQLSATAQNICANQQLNIKIGNLEENPLAQYYRQSSYSSSYSFYSTVFQYGDGSIFGGNNYSTLSYYDTAYTANLSRLQPGKINLRAIFNPTILIVRIPLILFL